MDGFRIDEVIALIRRRHALKSNYAVCQMLKISHQSMGNWLKGRTWPDERMCALLAEAAGIDGDVLTVYCQAQRTSGEAQDTWLRIARRLAGRRGQAANFAAAFAIDCVALDPMPEPPAGPRVHRLA